MLKLATNIDVKESIYDEKSDFNIKKFKIGSVRIDRPIKTIDAKVVKKDDIERIIKNFSTPIFEYSKVVNLKAINNILRETNDIKIKKFFGFKTWMVKYPYIFTHTFTFNPYVEFENVDDISGYFYYYYDFSDPILLIPSIKIERYDIVTKKKIPIISIDDYIKFVNDVYHLLDYKNKKPIFVPVSLRFGINDIKKLAKYYIKNDFLCVWFDFEGSAITKPKISRIRAFVREYERIERLDNLVIYSTNIKREIISNLKSEKTPASDVLISLTGSNLVGVNREPPRPIGITLSNEERKELRKHKARVFDPSTYYYTKVAKYNSHAYDLLMRQSYNILFNSQLLDTEFKIQTEHLLETGELEEYITKKQMIKEYKRGELGKVLFHKKVKKITEWF